MNSLIGLPCVASVGGNTGTARCSYDMKIIIGDILIPAGKTYPADDLENIVALMVADTKVDAILSRIFPFFGYEEVEAGNEERQRAQKGYGNYFETREEIIVRSYTIVGKNCLNQKAVKFRNRYAEYDRIAVFADGAIMGTERTGPTGDPAFGGFALTELYPGPYMEPDGSNPAQWTIRYTHASLAQWDNRVIVKPLFGNVLNDLKGLQDITLTNVKQTPVVAGEYHLNVTSGCGAINMAQLYPVAIIAAAIWKASAYPSGAAIDIDTIALSPAGRVVIKMDAADPDFIAATRIKIEMVGPTALGTAGVDGYESGYVIVPNS